MSTKKLVLGGLLVAIAVILQASRLILPLPPLLTTFIIGTLVNMMLVLCVRLNGFTSAVILAAGSGTRMGAGMPKQFLDILGTGKSFIRSTFERFLPLVPAENFLVVTNRNYKELVLEHLPELKENQVLCEPIGRNTAPCIAYAAYSLLKRDPEANMIVTPSDHLVLNEIDFHAIVKESLEFAVENGALMTIGIEPDRPETGYGYIQKSNSDVISRVKCFTEKPNLELAQAFVDCGEFFWNLIIMFLPIHIISPLSLIFLLSSNNVPSRSKIIAFIFFIFSYFYSMFFYNKHVFH